jgi:hypothetical protein
MHPTNPTQPNSYISSVLNVATSRLGALTASVGVSDVSRAASVHNALENFVKTATFKDIPDKVTQIGALETLSSTPAWYSALPSDVKSYYDQRNAQAQSVLNEIVNGPQSATPSGSGGAAPSGTAAGNAKPTGAASADKVVQYAGVGAAALFAGVFAL